MINIPTNISLKEVLWNLRLGFGNLHLKRLFVFVIFTSILLFQEKFTILLLLPFFSYFEKKVFKVINEMNYHFFFQFCQNILVTI